MGEVVRLGEEAGSGGEAVSQALTEVRRGRAGRAGGGRRRSTRALGAGRVVVSRVVAGADRDGAARGRPLPARAADDGAPAPRRSRRVGAGAGDLARAGPVARLLEALRVLAREPGRDHPVAGGGRRRRHRRHLQHRRLRDAARALHADGPARRRWRSRCSASAARRWCLASASTTSWRSPAAASPRAASSPSSGAATSRAAAASPSRPSASSTSSPCASKPGRRLAPRADAGRPVCDAERAHRQLKRRGRERRLRREPGFGAGARAARRAARGCPSGRGLLGARRRRRLVRRRRRRRSLSSETWKRAVGAGVGGQREVVVAGQAVARTPVESPVLDRVLGELHLDRDRRPGPCRPSCGTRARRAGRPRSGW